MRFILSIGAVLIAVGGCKGTVSGEFARSHAILHGNVQHASTNAPIQGVLLHVRLYVDSCRPGESQDAFFSAASEGDGSFRLTLDTLHITSERACLIIEADPPDSLGLAPDTLQVEDVPMVDTRSPPETVSVTITLEPGS